MTLQLLLIIISITSVVLGLIVWARRPDRQVNLAFVGLSSSVSLWVATNAVFADAPVDFQYLDALASYGAAGLTATFFLYFSMLLVSISKWRRYLLYIGIFLSILAAMPLLLATSVVDDSIQTTPFIIGYALFIVSYFGSAIALLVRYGREASKRRRKQIESVLIGAFIAIVGGAICNLIFPLLGNYSLVAVGPAFSLLFVFFFAYSIVKHHLFDIRRTLVRAIAYGFSILTLGLIVGFFSVAVIDSLDADQSDYQYAVIVTSLLIAALFEPTKKLFDKMTRRFFLSTEYDLQKAIDKMTDIFAKREELQTLIFETEKELINILGASDVRVVSALDSHLIKAIDHSPAKLIIKEDIEEDAKSDETVQAFEDSNAEIISELVTDEKKSGYLLVGPRANGTSYSRHDHSFIDIVVAEFAIAIENTKRMERIQTFNEDLKQKVREATSELRQSNKKLKALDESKDEFISMASHQLRTPLTSIKGYLSMVLEGDVGTITDEQRKMLEEAFNSSQRMVYLIGDFLNVSRLQTGKFELEKSDTNLPQLINEELSQLQATAQARGMSVNYQAPENFPTLLLDENKIRQVMMNFIDNAIYYAKPGGGNISIILARHTHHVSFKVIDDGIGVPKGERHQLFSKFYRASNAKKARPDGTGIGLFMAKKVIVAHGGAIIFESTEGKGSIFGFRLPLGGDTN